MARLNCKDIISHSCEGKHKSNLGFPILEELHFHLLCTFLELGGSSLFHPTLLNSSWVSKQNCTFGGTGTPPPQSSGHPLQCQETHVSINQGIWMTSSILSACRAADVRSHGKADVYFVAPLTRTSGSLDNLQRFQGELVFPVYSLVISYSFLLVPGGFHIKNKEQDMEAQQISAVFLLSKGKLTNESLQN